MKILMTGGGTGGHIYPGLAVAKELMCQGHVVYWGGRSAGMEKDLVQDLPYLWFWALALRSKNIFLQVKAILALFGSVVLGIFYLKRYRIDCVLTWGGYVSVAPALSAYLLRVPVVCFEQNTKLGLANRLIANIATRHLSGLACEDARFMTVGNPIRQAIVSVKPNEDAKRLLIVGGSLGASFLRENLLQAILEKFPELPITCIVGRNGLGKIHHEWLRLYPQLRLLEYCHDMANLYAETGFVISRSGAMAVSEILALGIRTIFVPLPQSADNHQWYNAISAQSEGIEVAGESAADIIEKLRVWQMGSWKKPVPRPNDAIVQIVAVLSRFSRS